MSCRRCGAPLPADARFCPHCGAPASGAHEAHPPVLDDRTQMIALGPDGGVAMDEPLAEAESLPPGSALLVVQRGPNAGSRFLLDAEVVTAGRHPDSDILLDDVTVSRRHAEFRRGATGWEVHDAGSLNGTYLNRSRIDAAPLQAGDDVQIGKFLIALVAVGPGDPSTSGGGPA